VAVDRRLRDRLIEELDLGGSQVDRLITQRARSLVLPREQAAIALALEAGVSVTRFAKDEDLAAIRGAAARQAPEPPPAEPARVSAGRKAPTARTARRRRRGKKVFVVHGRDSEMRHSMFRILRALGLDPIEFGRAVRATGKPAPYIGEILEAGIKDAVAVVVLLTPDDVARLKPPFRKRSDPPYESTLTGQARPNVLFEAGMAFGYHPMSTVIVEVGELRPFSDIWGRHVVHLDNSAVSRQELASRLDLAGCDVNTDGEDWLREGDFSA
jgi:predicted nucleotide-binding protein